MRLLIPLFVFASIAAQRSMAEVSELRISRGYGILYLPLFVIENQKPPALTSELESQSIGGRSAANARGSRHSVFRDPRRGDAVCDFHAPGGNHLGCAEERKDLFFSEIQDRPSS